MGGKVRVNSSSKGGHTFKDNVHLSNVEKITLITKYINKKYMEKQDRNNRKQKQS